MAAFGTSPGNGSSDTISVNPQNLTNVAPLFTSASKDTFEQQFLLDLMNQSLVGDMTLISSLARFAAALENFQERLSASMHCLGNEQEHVGQQLGNAAIAFGINENTIGSRFEHWNPGYQPQPGIEPLPAPGPLKPTWPEQEPWILPLLEP